jgi:sec-independent protein translocase protein TatA
MFEDLFQPTHLLLILIIVLIIFGAGKLPDAFGALGKGIKEFRDAAGGTIVTPVVKTSGRRFLR